MTTHRVDWITDSWGVAKGRTHHLWWVEFGDGEQSVSSGFYPTRRRAKKEITHYIERGLCRGPFPGAYKHLRGSL